MLVRIRSVGPVLVVLLVLGTGAWLLAGPLAPPTGPTEGDDGVLNPFIAGQPAKAAEVNHNFKVLAEALNNVESRLTSIESGLAAVDGRVTIGQLDVATSFTPPVLVGTSSLPAAGPDNAGQIVFLASSGEWLGSNGSAWVALNQDVRDIMSTSFTITADSVYWAAPSVVAKKTNLPGANSSSGHHHSQIGPGPRWVKVDFGKPRFVTAFGVHGYQGNSAQKPSDTWSLQGSSDDASWKVLWTGSADQWTNDAATTYPPPVTLEIPQPGNYRYYRVYADSWANDRLIMSNWAMYGF